MIKMIVTDLDRTLLRDDKTVSAYSIATLERCREKGIYVVFATARPLRAIRTYTAEVSPDAVIVHNGAGAYRNGKRLCSYGIDSATAKALLLSFSRKWPDATLSAEIDDAIYTNFTPPEEWEWNPVCVLRKDFSDLPDKSADKIIINASSHEEINRVKESLPDDLYVEMSDGKLGLIMHRKASKLNAVRLLSKHFGIDLRDMAAFGDDVNDVGMLRECGAGVAMANALDCVKECADTVCDSNERDGVAKWIEENVISKI